MYLIRDVSVHLPSNKSQILSEIVLEEEVSPPLKFDSIILDGAVIIHLLKAGHVKTFAEYSEKVFIPHLKGYLASTDRLDLVWDRYLPQSLKTSTREK